MGLQSMTGFGRARAASAEIAIAWEVRSVNGKSLEARLRLPPGMERLEQPARAAMQKRFTRGNLQATLTIARGGAAYAPIVNEAFLRELAQLATKLEAEFGVRPASADGLLALRGVLEPREAAEDEDGRAATDSLALDALGEALDELAAARLAEGGAIAEVLRRHVDRIEVLTIAARDDDSRSPPAIRARLAEQVRLLLETSPPLDPDRLHQEAAFLATKADISEEIDRLLTHVAAARALLAGAGPVGRKLDFLAQEFNREANTLCSKSNAAAVTAIGLELKVLVDQFREQVQNLE